MWFAGAHSNVGGGYPRQGMSLTALDWMMTRAEAFGLRFHADVRADYHGAADVNDKRYDSRAPAWGSSIGGNPATCSSCASKCGVEPKVHRSVFERIARNTEGYAPGSLPTSCQVVSTAARPDVRDSDSGHRCRRVSSWASAVAAYARAGSRSARLGYVVADPHHAGHRAG